tara:strand:- start:9596 stop:9760 length:165 start_codon:yes stop_codon:yes gene_type:complete
LRFLEVIEATFLFSFLVFVFLIAVFLGIIAKVAETAFDNAGLILVVFILFILIV